MGRDFNESVITLIPKAKANKGIQNWRPISLLTMVYKIISKALAQCLAPLMDSWVSEEQRGFIQGRCILDNLLLVKEAKAWAKKKKTPVILLSLNFKKAYDSISWKCLRRCLQHYGFGEYFLASIEILLKDVGACILINGEVSGQVEIWRAVRQGDPLAPTLFVIIIDFLIFAINESGEIIGIFDPRGCQLKVTCFADDTLLFLVPRAGLVEAAMALLQDFGEVSGCCINWIKTKLVILNDAIIPSVLTHIARISGDLSHPYLGLPLQEGDENAETGRQVCVRFMKKARGLQIQELSLPARILAINHIITATLWYFTFVWAPTEEEFKHLKTVVSNFLWNKDVDETTTARKVSWAHLTQPKKDGGLGLVDPVVKAKVLHGQWLLKAISPSNYPWKPFVQDRLAKISKEQNGAGQISHMLTLKPLLTDADAPTIWRSLWTGWLEIRTLLRFEPPET